MLQNRRVQSHFSIVFFWEFFPSKTRRNFNFFSIFQQNLHPARGVWEWPIPPDFSQFFSTLFPSIHLQGKGEGGFPKFLLGKSKKNGKKNPKPKEINPKAAPPSRKTQKNRKKTLENRTKSRNEHSSCRNSWVLVYDTTLQGKGRVIHREFREFWESRRQRDESEGAFPEGFLGDLEQERALVPRERSSWKRAGKGPKPLPQSGIWEWFSHFSFRKRVLAGIWGIPSQSRLFWDHYSFAKGKISFSLLFSSSFPAFFLLFPSSCSLGNVQPRVRVSCPGTSGNSRSLESASSQQNSPETFPNGKRIPGKTKKSQQKRWILLEKLPRSHPAPGIPGKRPAGPGTGTGNPKSPKIQHSRGNPGGIWDPPSLDPNPSGVWDHPNPNSIPNPIPIFPSDTRKGSGMFYVHGANSRLRADSQG